MALVALAIAGCTHSTPSAATLLEKPLSAQFQIDPNEPGERDAARNILGRDAGAASVAVEHLHVAVPPTPGQLTVYALTFDHPLDAAELTRITVALNHYLPTSGLSATNVHGIRLLARQDDAVLASTVVWTHDRRMLVVTGGSLENEEAFAVEALAPIRRV